MPIVSIDFVIKHYLSIRTFLSILFRHLFRLLVKLDFDPTNFKDVPSGQCTAVGYQKILLPALCRMQSGLFDKCERVGIVPLKMTFMPRQLGFYYSEPPLNNRPKQRRRDGAAATAEQVQGRKEDFKRTPRGSMIHGGTPKKVQIRRKMRLLSPLHADQPAHNYGSR